MLNKLFGRSKETKDEPAAEEVSAPATASTILLQTSNELHLLAMQYAIASIAAVEQRDTIALQSASLRLGKLSRQFKLSASLHEQDRSEEDD
jgi:hypothetical protein